MRLLNRKIWLVLAIIVVAVMAFIFFSRKEEIDFNTQVKPIFNKKCIACHGGVKQQAGFSLLFREEALGNTEAGRPAIIPGRPDKSELIRRITHNDPEERMPYKHEPLTAAEIKILKRWIKQGAMWGEHWAYTRIKEEPIPDYSNAWIKNNVDRFIYQQLKKQKLNHSAEAGKPELLRRVSLDLIGLPPDSIIADKYLADNSEKAYENLIDSLLASPAYGERWTSLWLDLARYADTKGYEADNGRSIWKYRDWLIRAFNADKPYNDFLTEQMAGDLLPNPDDTKYIATAFHRNTMTNDEGGTDNEEFRTAAVIDRINTTWSVLMGSTFNCVQCHSHPYDPFKHEEYYKFMAFFNNTRDEDTESDYPLLRQYKDKDSATFEKLTAWLQQYAPGKETDEQIQFLKTWQPLVFVSRCDELVNAATSGSAIELRNNGTCRIKDVLLNNSTQFMFRYVTIHNGGSLAIYLDSLNSKPYKVIPFAKTLKGWEVVTATITPVPGKRTLYLKYINPTIDAKHLNGTVFEWFRIGNALPGNAKPGYATASQWFNELIKSNPETTPVMMENQDDRFRSTHIFERGNWMTKGNEVTADVPHILNPIAQGMPKNRLGLSIWLTDKKNPLVARTMVNRLWEQLFGNGLVETLEDFGTQGAAPTHRELLDYLAWKFMHDYQWSIKKILKEIVMSATYRQDSKVNEELLQKDPYNKWYARGPRVRLSAEQLRDQSLAVSNLLSKKMYGVSVMPFQPEGIWHSPYNDAKWKMSEGEDQFRRAVYTYWKRSAPYPSMITLDASAREVCVTKRIRTNTPLQALATLNDSSYIVMARHLAYRMQQTSNNAKDQIAKGYNMMMYKPATPGRLEALMKLYDKARMKFKDNPDATFETIGVNNQHNNAEAAAMVVVANAMLNMDEWVNKN
jgi:hypothetical protein